MAQAKAKKDARVTQERRALRKKENR
jgi:hypothetical protein